MSNKKVVDYQAQLEYLEDARRKEKDEDYKVVLDKEILYVRKMLNLPDLVSKPICKQLEMF